MEAKYRSPLIYPCGFTIFYSCPIFIMKNPLFRPPYMLTGMSTMAPSCAFHGFLWVSAASPFNRIILPDRIFSSTLDSYRMKLSYTKSDHWSTHLAYTGSGSPGLEIAGKDFSTVLPRLLELRTLCTQYMSWLPHILHQCISEPPCPLLTTHWNPAECHISS